MARKRDYKAEYQRRLARGRERGLSTAQARGHARTQRGEKPVSVLNIETAITGRDSKTFAKAGYTTEWLEFRGNSLTEFQRAISNRGIRPEHADSMYAVINWQDENGQWHQRRTKAFDIDDAKEVKKEANKVIRKYQIRKRVGGLNEMASDTVTFELHFNTGRTA